LATPSPAANFAAISAPMAGIGIFVVPEPSTANAAIPPLAGIGMIVTPTVQVSFAITVVPLSGTGSVPVPVVITIVVFGQTPTETLAGAWNTSALEIDVDHAEQILELQANELQIDVEADSTSILVGAGTLRGELV
jgi:hypothetical protein